MDASPSCFSILAHVSCCRGLFDSVRTERTDSHMTKRGLQRTVFAVLAVAVSIVGLASTASADTIQIGTFSWDAIAEDEDEFLFFCDPSLPCSRFTVTNDLDDLTSSELSLLGLPNSEFAFDEVKMLGVLDGSLGSLTAAIGSFVWIASGQVDIAALSFTFFDGLKGIITFPQLTGPTAGPVGIFVETEPGPSPVPEPASLTLVAGGLLSLSTYMRRRQARARA